MDLANWMGALPSVLLNLPLTWLAIPGSHDSFSYSLYPDSSISPDEPRLQCFEHCFCFSKTIKRFIFKWTVTQSLECKQQLSYGIRYFDFRLASKQGTLVPYIVHGMYGASVITVLNEISAFLNEHQKEIVLLDFQHFYGFTEDAHAFLIETVQSIFGAKLCPYGTPLEQLTLSNLWRNKYQVLLFYRNIYGEAATFLWPGSSIPNPWPNSIRVSDLIRKLEANYRKGRDPKFFYVTQGVLSPDITYILTHFYTTLKKSIAPDANKALLEWVHSKSAGENGINIVMADYVDMKPFNLSCVIIKMNEKLAESVKA